jgi:DNA-binding beta-propeller fold protein YncE
VLATLNNLVLNENGSKLYISWGQPQKISIVKLIDHQSGNAEISENALGPIRVAKSKLYTLSAEHLDIIDLERRKESAHIPIDDAAIFLALNPEDTVLAIVHDGKGVGRVTFFRTRDNAEIAKVTVRGDLASAVFAPDGKKLYVADQQPMKDGEPDEEKPNNITIIDTSTHKLAATIPMKGELGAGAVSSNNKQAYFITAIKIPDKKRLLIKMAVSIVDTEAEKAVGEILIPVPDKPTKKCDGN